MAATAHLAVSVAVMRSPRSASDCVTSRPLGLSSQASIFEGCRFVIATYELVLLATSLYFVRRQRPLPQRAEVACHSTSWSAGVLVSVFFGVYCSHNPDNDWSHVDQQVPDILTMVWTGIVAVGMLGFFLVGRSMAVCWATAAFGSGVGCVCFVVDNWVALCSVCRS